VRFHLENAANLHKRDLFAISKTDDLIKGAQKLKCDAMNLALIGGTTQVSDDAREKMECFDVLKDIRGFIGDEKDIEVFQGLIHKAYFGGFNGGVLGVGGYEFWERG